MRDTTRLVALGRSAPVMKNEIRVYSPAGEGLMLFTVNDFAFSSTFSLADADAIQVGNGHHHSTWVDYGRATGCIE